MVDRVILFKTHCWSTDIEKFVIKIKKQIENTNICLYILLHDEQDTVYEMIDLTLREIVLKFKESDIKNLYDKGFFNMWLSNHWIMMWFFKMNSSYKYYWSIEYDVRIVGNTNIIWDCKEDTDFIYIAGNGLSPNNIYKDYYVGTLLNETDKYYGYLQLARYSNTALKYLDEKFIQGENGQDELITFSLINLTKLKRSNYFLHQYVKGKWTWQDKFSDYNKTIYNYYENIGKPYPVYILHPVK